MSKGVSLKYRLNCTDLEFLEEPEGKPSHTVLAKFFASSSSAGSERDEGVLSYVLRYEKSSWLIANGCFLSPIMFDCSDGAVVGGKIPQSVVGEREGGRRKGGGGQAFRVKSSFLGWRSCTTVKRRFSGSADLT